MDDALFYGLRRDPRPEFAAELRASLRRQEITLPARRRFPAARIAASIAAAAAATVLFSVPAVRAAAQSFLGMFRVVNFVAVPVDEHRIRTLQQIDLPRLIGEHVQVLQEPGPPVPAASLAQAGAAAGFDVRVPAWLPPDARIIEIAVAGERQLRVTADATRLQQLMDALGINDLRVPDGLDQQVVSVRVPPVVMVRYEHGGRHSRLLQARSPEVAMPVGVDPSALGEIGLRLLGLTREDARQFARSIDWNSTLLVPLPPTVSSVRHVDVAGNPGIALEFQPPNQSHTNAVLWSRGGRVFALVSIQEMPQVLQMANSIE
jgi:hypothetical protein